MLRKFHFEQFLNFNFPCNFCLHVEVKITGGVFLICVCHVPDSLEQNMTQPHGHTDFLGGH